MTNYNPQLPEMFIYDFPGKKPTKSFLLKEKLYFQKTALYFLEKFRQTGKEIYKDIARSDYSMVLSTQKEIDLIK